MRPGPPAAPGAVVAAARISYQNDQPYSLDFHDVYHAPDGAAEVQRVLVEPCGLDDLARQRTAATGPSQDLVRIGELGFGSGYNFVVAAERCLAAGARLHFVSFEAAPLDAADFAAIAAQRAPAHPLYRELAEAYPARIRGWHRRHLLAGRICLSLWWGAADAGLADLPGRQRQPFDAWFLDGFAPDRNAEMWEPALFQSLAALSTSGTRVATFTAAGRVRRGLEAAGFAMRRVDQRPYKHESLAGTFQATGLPAFVPPRQIEVAGGGLAGASAAWHLARAGFDVRLADPRTGVLDRSASEAPDPAPPASQVPVTVLHGRLLADGSAAADLRCHAYLYAAHVVRGLRGFDPTGALQVAAAGAPGEARLRALEALYAPSGAGLRWLDAGDAAALAGWPLPQGGLHFSAAGSVATPSLVRSLLDHERIETVTEALQEPDPQRLTVLACGAGMRAFAAARYLELAPVHGQLDLVALAAPPRLPLVGNGYLVPAQGMLAAGATYEYRPWDPAEATRANLAQLAGHHYQWRGRHRGTRCVSSDRTAIAGALTETADATGVGLYVSAGHGSSGNVSAHLAAAVLTGLISGEFAPLERRLEAVLAPARFRDRQARRGYRHGATP